MSIILHFVCIIAFSPAVLTPDPNPLPPRFAARRDSSTPRSESGRAHASSRHKRATRTVNTNVYLGGRAACPSNGGCSLCGPIQRARGRDRPPQRYFAAGAANATTSRFNSCATWRCTAVEG